MYDFDIVAFNPLNIVLFGYVCITNIKDGEHFSWNFQDLSEIAQGTIG